VVDTTLLFLQGYAAEEAGDFARAQAYFREGAALGDDNCWTHLGYMFDVGIGTPIDKVEAMRCYRMAWRNRCTIAANNIAILYRERGDHRAMFRWFERAALAGDGSPHLDLAKCYLDGVGVRRSVVAAQRCLAIAVGHEFISEEEREEAEALLAELRPRLVEPSNARVDKS
jgi:TPR repeat protein